MWEVHGCPKILCLWSLINVPDHICQLFPGFSVTFNISRSSVSRKIYWIVSLNILLCPLPVYLFCHFLVNPFKLFIYFHFIFFSFFLSLSFPFYFLSIFLGMSYFLCAAFNFVFISIMVLLIYFKNFTSFHISAGLCFKFLSYHIFHELLHICFIVCVCV